MRHASGGTSATWSVGQAAYCYDAVKNMNVCASVADALANGNDIGRLRAFSSQLLRQGYAMAANAIADKADRLERGGA